MVSAKCWIGYHQLTLPPASWTMSREGRAAFLKERLAGAQHFDIDEVSDQSSPYPHMIPSPHLFQDLVAKVRVQSHTGVILHFIVIHLFNSTVIYSFVL